MIGLPCTTDAKAIATHSCCGFDMLLRSGGLGGLVYPPLDTNTWRLDIKEATRSAYR